MSGLGIFLIGALCGAVATFVGCAFALAFYLRGERE